MKAFLAVLACAGLIVATRLPWFGDHLYNLDTAVRGTLGWGWSEGLVPLRDLYGSTKPPGLDLLYMGLFKVFGVSLVSLQWLTLVLTLLNTLLVGLLAKALFDARAAWYATFAYIGATCFAYGPMDWLDPHSEYVVTLLVLLGALALLPLGRGGSSLWAFPAGLVLAQSALVRQNALVFALSLALGYAVLAWHHRPKVLPFALLWGLTGLAAGLVPWIWYFQRLGALDALVLFSWKLPGTYASGNSPAVWAMVLPFALGKWALACAPVAGLSAWYLLQRDDGGRLRGTRLLLLSLVLGGTVAASLGGRFFGHYFLMMAPFAALSVAGAVAVLAPSYYSGGSTKPSSESVTRMVALLFLVWLLAGTLATIQPAIRAQVKHDEGALNGYLDGENDRVRATAALVKKASPDGSRIAVFGHPSLYLMTGRLPAVRDFWGNFLTGYYGHTSTPGAFTFAESHWAQDLATKKAALVVDLGGGGGERLKDYPKIAAALAQYYRFSPELSAKVPGLLVWVPKKPVKPAR